MSRLNVANFRHPDGTADNLNLDSSGRVGIGTTTPSQKLHVASNASTYIQVQNTGDSVNAYYGVDTAAAWVGSSTNHPLVFHTNNTERARIDSSGNFRFNSGYGSVATAYGVRAWVNFDGTSGSIGTGRASGNCSSITDLGTGYYQFNFSSMVDGNYAVAGSVISSTNTDSTYGFIVGASSAANSVHSSSAFRFTTLHISSNVYDYNQVQIIVVR